MFNIGMGEIILILLVAFVVVGPEDLPKVARYLGKSVRKLRGIIREIKRESGWSDIEKEFKDTSEEMKQVSREVRNAADDVRRETRNAEKEIVKSTEILRDEIHSETINGSNGGKRA